MNQETLEKLPKIWVGWIWTYLILGGLMLARGGTSFLAAPWDQPLPLWFKLVFLNVPLQIAVVLAAMVLLNRSKAGHPSRPAVWLAVAATTLIGVNFLVAVLFVFISRLALL